MNISSRDGLIPENLLSKWYTVNIFPFSKKFPILFIKLIIILFFLNKHHDICNYQNQIQKIYF